MGNGIVCRDRIAVLDSCICRIDKGVRECRGIIGCFLVVVCDVLALRDGSQDVYVGDVAVCSCLHGDHERDERAEGMEMVCISVVDALADDALSCVDGVAILLGIVLCGGEEEEEDSETDKKADKTVGKKKDVEEE